MVLAITASMWLCLEGRGEEKVAASSVTGTTTNIFSLKSSTKRGGGGRDNSVSPTSSVSTGTQGLSGRDSFGNMEGRSRNRGDGMRSGY